MKLKELANKFLNHSVINASGKQYRICEIEFYIYSAEHPDEYTHKAPEQKIMNKWYFHKKGKSYKEGTYKGLDITLGNNKCYVGVLIRSILNLETNELIEGPCNCVNELIGNIKVSEFLEGCETPLSITNNSKNLIVETADLEAMQIYHGRRYGLSDKYLEYKSRKYRFLIFPEVIKKQKSDLTPI